jgi:hypothetical protein
MFRSKNDFHSQHKRYNRPPSWPRLIWRYVVVLTYYPIHISLALKEKVQETYENSEYLYRKNLAEQMRPPVVTKRKRALTIPRSDNERTLHTRKQKTYDQTQSYLLQLPIELRFLIWEACIGSDDIYILLTNELSQRNARDHLEAFRNTEVSDEPVERLGEIQEDVLRNIEQRRRQRTRLDVLALLQTCRLVSVNTS